MARKKLYNLQRTCQNFGHKYSFWIMWPCGDKLQYHSAHTDQRLAEGLTQSQCKRIKAALPHYDWRQEPHNPSTTRWISREDFLSRGPSFHLSSLLV